MRWAAVIKRTGFLFSLTSCSFRGEYTGHPTQIRLCFFPEPVLPCFPRNLPCDTFENSLFGCVGNLSASAQPTTLGQHKKQRAPVGGTGLRAPIQAAPRKCATTLSTASGANLLAHHRDILPCN